MKTFSILIVLFLLLIPVVCSSATVDRCKQYVQEERVQHFKYLGLSFPYHYGVAQIHTESWCRVDAISPDGGMGLSQFMPLTLKYVEKWLGDLDIYNAKHAIRAQAWYMRQLHKANFGEDKPLWITYMFYNSGQGTVTKEFKRAGIAEYDAMKEVCQRGTFMGRSKCDIGYDYPQLIYDRGQLYKLFEEEVRFWND